MTDLATSWLCTVLKPWWSAPFQEGSEPPWTRWIEQNRSAWRAPGCTHQSLSQRFQNDPENVLVKPWRLSGENYLDVFFGEIFCDPPHKYLVHCLVFVWVLIKTISELLFWWSWCTDPSLLAFGNFYVAPTSVNHVTLQEHLKYPGWNLEDAPRPLPSSRPPCQQIWWIRTLLTRHCQDAS